MSDVLISSLPWGVVQNSAGEAQIGVAYSITTLADAPVTSGTTNGFGEMSGSLPTGIYKVTVLGRTKVVHVWEADESMGGAALSGPVTSPDFVANMATQAELDPVAAAAAAARVFRTSHTWALGGPLTIGMFVPRCNVPKRSNQTIQLLSIRAGIVSGASANCQLIRNGSNVGSAFSVTTTVATFTPTGLPLTLADLDQIWFSITGIGSTPADMSFSAIFEHTVT